VDHLVYATPDLNASVDHLEQVLGVRATYGGHHWGRGTHNALLSLGPAVYLEILAPDPGQPEPAGPRWLGLDNVAAPRFVTWAAKASDLQTFVDRAAQRNIPLGAVQQGSRKRPDGVELTWQLTVSEGLVANGLVPFFIDWGTSPHPAISAAQGLELVGLHAEHPDANSIRRLFEVLGLEIPVLEDRSAALVATIKTPHGIVELR